MVEAKTKMPYTLQEGGKMKNEIHGMLDGI